MANQDVLQICCDPVVLDFSALITDVKTLRAKAGFPTSDPVDPGYTPDFILQEVIDSYKSALQNIAEQRHRDQCQAYAKLKDEVDMHNERVKQRVDATIEAALSGEDVPFRVEEYAHEVPIEMCPSAASTKKGGVPLVSYGWVEEPYINKPIKVIGLYDDGTRIVLNEDSDLDGSVACAFHDLYRYETRGRQIFVSNNGFDMKWIVATLYDRVRLEDIAKSTIEDSVESDLLDNFTVRVGNELIADLLPEFRQRMILEARGELSARVAEGTRLERQNDE